MPVAELVKSLREIRSRFRAGRGKAAAKAILSSSNNTCREVTTRGFSTPRFSCIDDLIFLLHAERNSKARNNRARARGTWNSTIRIAGVLESFWSPYRPWWRFGVQIHRD